LKISIEDEVVSNSREDEKTFFDGRSVFEIDFWVE
jgi:hypothetical protein